MTHLRSLLRREDRAKEKALPGGAPLLESLEPRVLLSADSLPLEPLVPMESPLGTSVVNVDLNQPQNHDSTTLVTYFLSSDDTDISAPETAASEGAEADQRGDAVLGQTVQLLGADSPLVSAAESEEMLPSIPAGQSQLGVQSDVKAEESAVSVPSDTTSLIPVDPQEYALRSQSSPISSRGPPTENEDSATSLYCSTYDSESELAQRIGGSVATNGGLTALDLPGLELVDPNPANLAGQIIYLDFDGAADVRYDGPVTIGPFDVPAFQAPDTWAGQEQTLVEQTLAGVERLFAGSGVVFTLRQPAADEPHSTIYIGGTSAAFAPYGSFLGLAEQVDIGDEDASDNAFVFADELTGSSGEQNEYAAELTQLIAHEAAHLLGYAHEGFPEHQEDPLGRCAAVLYIDKNSTQANDSNPGTEALPLQTIDRALAVVQPGDTVYVKGGTNTADPKAIYDRSGRNGLPIQTAGMANSPIILAAYPGDTVVLQGNGTNNGIALDYASYHEIRGFVFRDFDKATEGFAAKTDILIENCEFTITHTAGLRLRNITNLTLRDVNVHHTFEAGIYIINSSHVRLERVISSFNDDLLGASGDADGIDTVAVDDFVAVDSTAEGNSEDGFDLNSDGFLINCVSKNNNVAGVKLWRRSEDGYKPRKMTLVNCVVSGHNEAGIKASVGAALDLFNSVVYGNGEEGVAFRSTTAVTTPVYSRVFNTIIAGNGWNGIVAAGTAVNVVDASNNLYYRNGSANAGLHSDTGSISGQDPLFVDSASGVFQLRAGSPAVDHGLIISGYHCPTAGDHPDQNLHQWYGSAPDIGAYEVALSPIVDLAVTGTGPDSISLAWTVPGDSLLMRKPTAYDIRYADTPLTDSNWATAVQVPNQLTAGDFGQAQSFVITGLNGTSTYSIAIKTTDELGNTSWLSNVVSGTTATSGNHAPVLAAIGNQSINVGQLLTFTASATDSDVPANSLAFSLLNAPAGASIDPTTGVFNWIPAESQGPGSYDLTVRVTDNGTPNLYDEEAIAITVTVNQVNTAPVLAAIGNQSMNEGQLLTFTARATDSDIPANTLTFSLLNAPTGASINASSGLFNWTPTEAQGPGSYNLTVRVTDNGSPNLYDEQAITITVNEVNTAPILAAIGNKSINEGQLLTFTAHATDSDIPANTLTFSLLNAPAGASINASTGVFNWTPTEAQGPGSYSLTVRVTDDGTSNLYDEEAITITVSIAQAAEILYVDNQLTADSVGTYSIANRNNSGSDGNAYRTIEAAAAAAAAGNIIYIRAGTYRPATRISIANKTGTSSTAKITVANYNGETVVLDGSQTPVSSGYGLIDISNSDYVVLQGLTIQNYSQVGIRYYNSRFGEIRDLSVQGTGSYGLHLHNAHNSIVEAVTIANSSSNGIRLTDANDVQITHSVIYDNVGYGIYLRGACRTLVDTNEIYANYGGVMTTYHDSLGITAENNVIRNNLIHDNISVPENSDGIAVSSGSYYNVVSSNIVYGNADDAIDVSTGGGATGIASNLYATITGNIVFRNGDGPTGAGDGNGIKVSTNNGGGHTVAANVSFDNERGGFDQDKSPGFPQNFFYQNIAYNNPSGGFIMDAPSLPQNEDAILYNNIAVNNGVNDLRKSNDLAVNDSDYNWWGDGEFVAGMDAHSLSGDPHFNNPGLVVDTTFGADWTIEQKLEYIRAQVREKFSLQAGSQAVDHGRIIAGYHCTTAGAHPDQNLREWYGSAPDIGAYEVGAVALSPITDLSVSGTNQNSLTLTWTAPGGPEYGLPTQYDIRYADSAITEATWSTATQVSGEPVPGSFGTPQSFTITGLTPGSTYYVAVKTQDELGNISWLSNVVAGTTTIGGIQAPVITGIAVDTGIAGDGITSDQTLVINGTANANGMVILYVNGGAIGTTWASGSGNWTYDHTAVPLANGIYTLTATVTDVEGNNSAPSAPYSVKIDTLAPTALSLSNSGVAENQPIGTLAGTFTTTDPTAQDSHVYSLVAGTGSMDNASFTLSGSQLRTAAVFNYEAKTSYSIRARTTDAAGLTYEQAFTIAVTDINDAPTDIQLSNTSTPEHQPAGTTVGTFSTTDPDIGNTFLYTLVSGSGSADNGSFSLSGNTLRTAAVFDYGNKSGYSIRVRSTDQGGLSFDKVFAITVTIVNGAPAVAITAPSSGATFTEGADITINATASDTDGTVASIAFYRDSTWIGTDDSSPYSVTWSNVPPGDYALTALVTDNDGLQTTSGIVNITVSANGSSTIYPAEDASYGGGSVFETKNGGFNGTGYINFSSSGGYLQFNNVDGGGGGSAALTIRFALGITSSRTGLLIVNGVSQNITFDPTGAWTTWTNKDLTISLSSGATNIIRLESNGNDLANIDEITVTARSPQVTVAVTPVAVAEDGATNLVYTFTRSVVASSPLLVNFSVAGTATYGTDYTQTGAASCTATAGTVWIAANQTTAQVTVDPAEDGTVEPDETVILAVTAGTGYTIGTPAGATGTILNAVAPALSWDIDDNGRCDALTDGLLITRYLFGFRGDTLIADAVAPDANRSVATDIETYLAFAGSAGMLDIDGNGADDALTDGLLITRYLFGFRGDALIDSAVAPGATRTTAAQIEAFLASYMPVSGSPPASNDAPVLAAIGNKSIDEGQLLTFTASATDSDIPADTLTFMLWNAPEGARIDSSTGVFTWAPTDSQSPGPYTLTVRVTDDGTPNLYDQEAITITVNDANVPPGDVVLRVDSLETVSSGFVVHFNRPVDPDILNLYDTEARLYGPPDVTVVGATVGPVAGSLICQEEGTTVSFVKTGGPLEPDTYTVTLRSAVDAFRDSQGRPLDGDSDNVQGGDYVATVTIEPTVTRFLSLPDFARGPGQAVNVPATGSGIPVTLSDGSGVLAVNLDFVYSPAILTIAGVSLPPSLPAGWTLAYSLSTPGRASVMISGPTPLPAGKLSLVEIQAAIPENAPYGAGQILGLSNIQINQGAMAAQSDWGVQVIAYFGDTTGNHLYSTLDATCLSRIGVRLDSGFAAYPMKDPVLIGDVTGNGQVSTLDAAYVANKAVGLSVPQIPDLPAGLPALVASGPDPVLTVLLGLSASPGETLTVPVSLDLSDLGPTDLLLAGNVELQYDTNVFDVANADVRLGALLSGWSLAANVDDTTGQARLGFYNTTSPSGTSGTALEIDFHVRLDAPPGLTTLDLLDSSSLMEGQLRLTLKDGEVTIIGVNSAPVAGDDGYATVEDSALVVDAAHGVLSNDGDADPIDSVSVALASVTQPAHGKVAVNADGSFRYTPDQDYFGTDGFAYQAIDSQGALSNIAAVTIVVSADNDAPVLGSVASQTVDEGHTLTFTVTASDVDTPLRDLMFKLDADAPAGASITAGGVFAWTPTEGQGPSNYTFAVMVSDGTATDSGMITVLVNEINVAPILTAIGNQSIDEGQLLTFTATATDSDIPANSLTFSLRNAPTGASIDPASGVFNWTPAEDQGPGSYNLTIRVTDNGTPNLSDEEMIAITVNKVNVNGPPTAIQLSSTGIPENQSAGTTVGTFSTTDADSGDTFTYSLVSGSGSKDNGSFAVSGNLLQTMASFNYETKNSYNIRVRTTDSGGLWCEQAFTILVTDVNEAPTTIQISNSTVLEKQPVGTVVGRLSTADPDSGDTFTYSLVPGKGGRNNDSFRISGNSLQTAASFTYQGKNNYTIRVRTTDSGGLVYDCVFTITVIGDNQAPTAIQLSNSSVLENQPAGTIVGTLSTTDPDSGDTFSYTLVSGKGRKRNDPFRISGDTLMTTASFDYETQNSYSIRVRTTDSGGLTYEQAFTIAVIDINESAVAPLSNSLLADVACIDNGSFGIRGNTLPIAVSFTVGRSPDGLYSTMPRLPGLQLGNPSSASLSGQVIYLDFDGATDVVYDGPITMGPLDIPSFQAPDRLGGREQQIITRVVAELEITFAGSGVVFTTNEPPAGQPYSTVYIGGDGSSFSGYGSFLGLAEQVDLGNEDRTDKALVFSDRLAEISGNLNRYAADLARLIAHEVGHLLGYQH